MLSTSQLIEEITRRPGLIPICVDSVRQEIGWADLDGYHCYEGFFDQALLNYEAIRRGKCPVFESSLDSLIPALRTINEIGVVIPPTVFIFHAGRCGSTLLARVLARSRSNLVFGEAQAHNGIWPVLAGLAHQSGITLYRSLLLAMGRRRLSSYRAHVVKFTSYNSVRFGMIRAAFPATPALFLFREPAGLIDSYDSDPPPWLERDLGIGKLWPSAPTAVADFFRSALGIQDSLFRCLEYADLTPQNLPAILHFFNLEYSVAELSQMLAEFAWDAKGRQRRPFVPRRREQSSSPTGQLRDLYSQLCHRSRADWGDTIRLVHEGHVGGTSKAEY